MRKILYIGATHCSDEEVGRGSFARSVGNRRLAGAFAAFAIAGILVLAGCDEPDIIDRTAPTISASSVAAATLIGATVRVTVSEAGSKLFWVAYVDGTAAPADASVLIADAGRAVHAPIVANSGDSGQAVPAAGAVSIDITGLTRGTNYDVYVVAQDATGNVSALSAKLDLRTAQDTTAPTVSNPRITSRTLIGATVSVTVNEAGSRLFWVVYVDGTAAPADASVLIADAGKAINAPIVANSGVSGQAVLEAGAVSIGITGLTSGTNYDVYVVAQDAIGNNSVLSANLDLRTVPDTTAPTVSNPSITARTLSGATVGVTVSEAGKIFWVAYVDDTAAPADASMLIADASGATNAPIVANSGVSGQTVLEAGAVSIDITGLTSGTNYDVHLYIVAQDVAGNVSTLSAKLGLRTVMDTTAPTVSSPSIAATTTGGATVGVTVSEAGRLFWVAYADDTAAPTSALVLIADAGREINAPIVANSGDSGQALLEASTVSLDITGLTGGTNYDVYTVAQDIAGNISALSAKIDIGTPPAQTVTVGTVSIASGQASIPITNHTAEVRVRVSISPAAPAATYAVDGSSVSNIATTGLTLAASAMQTLVIGNLTSGTVYIISLTTVGANGIAHSNIINRSITLTVLDAFVLDTQHHL